MKRATLLKISVAAALVALPTAAILGFGGVTGADAQGFPPPPPTTYYGNASGAESGQNVVAVVLSGSKSTMCGSSQVVMDGGQPVYAIDVATDDQITGCGDSGRTVRFYFSPSEGGSGGGQMATQSVSWQEAGAHQQNLTLGSQLSNVQAVPFLARDSQ